MGNREFSAREFGIRELADMETLHSGHAADMKIETEGARVWIARTGEGYEGHGGRYAEISVEHLTDEGWRTTSTHYPYGKPW
jgi:hypothetical protein